MEQYTSEVARRELRRILNEVERGGSVAITRYGKPLAEVVPATTTAALAAFEEAMPIALRTLRNVHSDESRGALEQIMRILGTTGED